MIYVDETIKNTYRVPQPEGRGKFIRLDQNENSDAIMNSVLSKIKFSEATEAPAETIDENTDFSAGLDF